MPTTLGRNNQTRTQEDKTGSMDTASLVVPSTAQICRHDDWQVLITGGDC